MWIRGWKIEGFGHFHDVLQDDLAPGLTVVYGPNEAGKSTLLAFIRYMLFGFPHSNAKDPLYRPQRGGAHGGRLFVEAEGQGYTIERRAGAGGATRVVRDDGEVLPDLARLVGTADRALFQSVFAFGLDELRAFEGLNHQAVRDRIFSGSILGTGRSPQEALNQLVERRLALYGPQRRNSTIQLKLQGLQAGRGELERARQAGLGYDALLRSEDELAAAVATLTDEHEALRRRAAELETAQAAWPEFFAGRMAEEELAALDPIDSVPSEALARLGQLEARLEALGATADERAAEVERLQQVVVALQDDPAALAAAADVAAAIERRGLASTWAEKAAGARARAHGLETSLAAQLAALGAGWDRARLVAYDRGLARQEAIRAHETAIAQARNASAAALVAQERAQEQHDAGTGRVDGLLARVAGLAADGAGPPDQRGRAVANLGELLARRTAERAGLADDERLRDEARLDAEAASQDVGPPAWLKPTALALGLLLAALGSWRLLAGEVVGLVVLLLGLSIAMAPFVLRFGGGGVRQAAQARLERAEKALAVRRTRLVALADEIAKLGVAAGLSGEPEIADLEGVRQAIARQDALRTQRTQLEEELAAGQRELAAAGVRLQEARDRAAVRQAELTQAEQAWRDWKAEADLAATLSAQGAIDFLEVVRRGQEEVRAHDVALAEATSLDAELQAYLGQVAVAFGPLGLAAPVDLTAATSGLETAGRRCDVAREVARRREQLAGQLDDAERAAARSRADRGSAEDALAALLAEGAALDPASLRRRVALYERREALAERMATAARAVSLRLGAGERADAMLADLQAGQPERWALEASTLAARAPVLQAERDAAIERRRDAETARRSLEAATDLPRLEAEREVAQAELAATVRQWRVLALAEALIADTLERFERERQPAVIARAAQLFEGVTAGTYPRMRRHDRGIVVVDREGGEREAEAMSRGTREQLYLCIRLGLCREFSALGGALPMVMDDVLVNFDQERAAAVGRMLIEVAREQQILLFTCQPHTRDLLRSLDGRVKVVELPRYAGAAVPAPVALSPVAAREASRAVPMADLAAAALDGPLSAGAEAILAIVAEASEPLNKASIQAQAELSEEAWAQGLRELKARRLIGQQGHGRGTTYAAMTEPDEAPTVMV